MNKEDFGAVKNLYESIITEAPLRDEPLWDGPNDKPSGPMKPAKSTPVRARDRFPVTNSLGGVNLDAKATYTKPTTGTPTKVTPAKPGTSSSASASTADKIKGGMQVYSAQKKAGDVKGAAETGMSVNKLKYGDNFAKPKTPNPLMKDMPGQNKAELDQLRGNAAVNSISQSSSAKNILSGTAKSATANQIGKASLNRSAAAVEAPAPKPAAPVVAAPKPTPSTSPIKKPGAVMSSFEWGTKATLKDVANAYSSIYEAKKKDQDQDGDNDFADVRIARMMASGMSKAEAIAAVRNKEYNEEFGLDEATRMRKELGKEGETSVRKELAARSKAYQRSGSVDKTIAAAERGADRPYIKHKRDESDADRKKREERQSRTLRGLAASRRGSVRDKPRVQLRGYAAKVEGGDKDLQSARSSAMSAGTLTPREKKELGEVYQIVASYLLENNFAETLNDANVIIENMSEVWLSQILKNVN